MLGLMMPIAALASEFDAGLHTLWEVLWHQSGTPTRIVRWENDMRVRFTGTNLAVHREHMMEALRTVAGEAKVKITDVTATVDESTANVTVEILADNALEDNQPCVTFLDFKTETRIDSAQVQMRDRDAWRCAYHESMHVMGVRGHPAGQTVLSYFPWKIDGLLPLDRVMLRAWYNPRMQGGMTPFEALPVLADELVATMPPSQKQASMRTRDAFYTDTIRQMHSYANGTGDVPQIVKRSGKSTSEGIRYGRAEMSYFLGIAYLEGATVPRDATEAVRWLERASAMGNRGAQAKLGGFR
ncbi:DUF2927 domain-containing protein [Ramlibacter sp. PS4R-6]|uniref:DUF2927 domain-containing protein n=1 Tax=Ramlibacter sp. PS4R-6 TaxID=3133438 RepID=UPI0030B428C7